MNETQEVIKDIVDKNLEKAFEDFKTLDYYEARWSEKGEPTDIQCDSYLTKFKTSPDSFSTRSSVGPVIQKYHKSIDLASRLGCRSPYEYFEYLKQDKEAFKKFYTNRLSCSDWYNEKNGKNRDFLYKGFVPPFIYVIGLSTSYLAPRVSLFKPIVAKTLIQEYLSEYQQVFDPFSGYSARLLGTLALDKQYIGRDINTRTVTEANEILQLLKARKDYTLANCSSIEVKDAFSGATKETFESLFTCPPYSNANGVQIEIWKDFDNKTIHCVKSCDEIIEFCLDSYSCKKYVFVVDDSSTKFDKYVKRILINPGYMQKKNKNNTEKVVVVER